jgi:hypothetical protein
MSIYKINDVIRAYLGIRTEIEEMGKRHEAELAPLVDKKTRVEQWLLAKLNELNLDSLPTEAGTAFKRKTSQIKVTNIDDFWQFLRNRNDAIRFFPARANAEAVNEYIEDHQTPPPGVSVQQVINVSVRKK